MESDYLRERNRYSNHNPVQQESDFTLDDLIHQKGRILQTKLEVLATEMIERLRIRSRNLEAINRDHEHATVLLNQLAVQANYHIREHSDKRVFYETLFSLERERREQDVECWQDIVQVMRDFLLAWEAHQQAKARATFLGHAGS
jgi:hypothetical protein